MVKLCLQELYSHYVHYYYHNHHHHHYWILYHHHPSRVRPCSVWASFNSLLKGPFAVYFSINVGEFVMYLFLTSERYCCIILAIKCMDHWIKMYWLKPHSFLSLIDLTTVRLILLLYYLHFFVTAFDIIFSDYCLVFEVSHCRQARSVRFGDIMLVLNRKRTRLLPE